MPYNSDKNLERIAAAKAAINTHVMEQNGAGGDDSEIRVLDLISDCLLLLNSEDPEGLSSYGIEKLFRQAKRNFDAEKGGAS